MISGKKKFLNLKKTLDAYFSVNKNFIPNEEDVSEYIKVQDRDRDGRLT
jgi:hypothetical protein